MVSTMSAGSFQHIVRVLLPATWWMATLCLAGTGLAYAQNTSLSPHGEFELDIGCANCHQTTGWTPVLDELAFDHNSQTGFMLTGSHIDTACSFCHIDNRFDQPVASATECAVCHIDVHQGAYSEACVDCHNTTLFQEVEGIGMHAQTNFPLTGAHAQLTCTNCHADDTGGAFTVLETECYDCHADDYTESLLVDHVAAGFSTECEQCHTDLQWQGARFAHVEASNGFNLLGAHEGLACASCHASPGLAGIFQPASDQDCIACHENDYEDEHAGSGVPQTCLDCHNQDDWDDAEFDHDREYFPIYSGEHRDAWDRQTCTTCHLQPENFLFFSCEGACHEHTEDRMNREHRDVGDYVFASTACLRCHPDGDD